MYVKWSREPNYLFCISENGHFMNGIFIDREFGRQAFGDDPARYHAARRVDR